MDCVAVAQLIFPGTSTEASFWCIFSARVNYTFGLCKDFANRDQKSFIATFQSHSSDLSIKSVNELHCHSFNVHANCAEKFLLHHLHVIKLIDVVDVLIAVFQVLANLEPMADI